jgi:hypothetical protein
MTDKIPAAERSVADLSRLINVVSAGPWVVAEAILGLA